MGSVAGLDTMQNRRVCRPCQVSNPLPPSSAHNLAAVSPEKRNVVLINADNRRELHAIGVDEIATMKNGRLDGKGGGRGQ